MLVRVSDVTKETSLEANSEMLHVLEYRDKINIGNIFSTKYVNIDTAFC
jgi:hypothetical protein